MRHASLVPLALVALAVSACAIPQGARTSRFSHGEVAPVRAVQVTPERPARSTRSTAAVARFVRAHQRDLQFCRDEARLRGAEVTGAATVEVTLAEDGYVLRARVTQREWSADARAMEECVLGTVRKWVFPESDTLDEYVHAFAVDFAPGAAR